MTLEDENLALRAACRTLEGVVATETSAREMCEREKAELWNELRYLIAEVEQLQGVFVPCVPRAKAVLNKYRINGKQ